MRIIAGSLGGRIFEAPRGHRTHPMGDRVRGGLFNTLGDISGLTILDAFAGSGALSFEAISRGAASAVAVDNDRTAQQTIAANIASLGLSEKVRLARMSATAWTAANQAAHYDLILCDPPYDNLQTPLITKLISHLAPEGVLALSWPGKAELPEFPGLKNIAVHSYGDAQIAFYQR